MSSARSEIRQAVTFGSLLAGMKPNLHRSSATAMEKHALKNNEVF